MLLNYLQIIIAFISGLVAIAPITVAFLVAAVAVLITTLIAVIAALVTIAIAAGATGFSHVNDSGFWMISRYFRMTEAQTLRTWTVISTVISFVGFGLASVIWMFV